MSYDLMFQKAIKLHNEGALQQAEEIYQQLLQVMPENSDVWNLLGLIAQSQGNLLHARDCFLSAIRFAPAPFYAHFFNLGLTYKSLNKPNESIEALQRATSLNTDFLEGWNLLGVLYAENSDLSEAKKCFFNALSIDPNFIDALANLYYYTRNYDKLQALANEKCDNFMAQLNTGLLSNNVNDKEKYALRAYNIDSNRLEALLLLVECYQQKKDVDNTLKFSHKVLNIDKNNVYAVISLADVYSVMGQLEEAEKYYLRSFSLTRSSVRAHVNYGALLYQQKRLSEALEHYRAAVQLDPNLPEISYNLALILKDMGDFEEALGLMFHAHLKDPDNDLFSINILETLVEFYQLKPQIALKIAENWCKQEPDSVFSKKILSSFNGIIPKDEYLYDEILFDQFADTYDYTMKSLNYNVINLFQKVHGPVIGDILDLGCGTGLAAKILKNCDNNFDGVDISKNMLKIAQKKNLYRHLYQQDLIYFLQHTDLSSYSMALAFDVFCYFGDLSLVFKSLQGIKLCFSIELADENNPVDFYAVANGRCKHQKYYVEALLKKFHYNNVKSYSHIIREEKGKEVYGVLFIAE
ncbi:MAG: tetratricopeptide repeat protein [Alphaproteobacteria bacterium]|nr:tetratricopeptide repeat protein [Alphaproteobacteria bacterium]